MNKWKEAFKNVLWLFVFLVVVPVVFMGLGETQNGTTFFQCQPVPLGLPQCDGGDCKNEKCGNGVCNALCETKASCPSDCCSDAICGNGSCEYTCGESFQSCPQDCCNILTVRCGDGNCNSDCGENATNCAADCIPKDVKCGDPRVVSTATFECKALGITCTSTHEVKDCINSQGQSFTVDLGTFFSPDVCADPVCRAVKLKPLGGK